MISLLLASMFGTAQAVPMQLSQQGRLVDSSGVAAAGNHNLTFRLYNASTGGTLLWNETVSTNFTNGYYSVVLGSDTINNPLEDSVLESGDLYVEIEIDSDGPLTPRSAITSTPFARVAGKAQSADWSGLTSVPSGLDTADSRISALESLMTTMQADLATANTTISTLQSDLATTQSDLALAQSDLATAQGDLATANTTIASLESSLAGNTTDIASNTSSINALETDLTAAEASIATLQTDLSGISDNVLDMISVDTTWNIGSSGDYTDLVDAMAAARSVRIHPDATLTLQLDNDLHVMTETVNLNHPDGSNLVIAGNASDNSLVKLQFSGVDAGLLLDEANTIGVIRDLTLQGDGTGYGLHVMDGSTVLYAYNLVIEEFHTGIRAFYDSSVLCEGDILTQNNAGTGIYIRHNSTFIHEGVGAVTSTGNGAAGIQMAWGSSGEAFEIDVNSNQDRGVRSLYGSLFYTKDANISNNTSYGAEAYLGSVLYAPSTIFEGNTSSGVRGHFSSTVFANSSTFSNNGSYGLTAEYTSSFYCNSCTADGNLYGAGTHYSSSMFSSGFDISNSTNSGFISSGSSGSYLKNATISGNGGHAVSSYNGSFILETGMTYSGNGNTNIYTETGSITD